MKKHRPPGFLANLRKFRGCRVGASAVEFALISPVFLVMVGGILEIGRALYIRNTLQYAVEEAARYAMINTSATSTQVEAYAASKVPDVANIDVSNFAAESATEDSITYMTITGTFEFSVLADITPLPDMTLTAKSKVPLY